MLAALRLHFIAGDYLDDVLSIRLCWLRYVWLWATQRVSKRRYCQSGNGSNEQAAGGHRQGVRLVSNQCY
jgi:hypothetical protein